MPSLKDLIGFGLGSREQDWAKLEAKARRLKDEHQLAAALQCLEERVGKTARNPKAVKETGFVSCLLLLRLCQAESAVQHGDPERLVHGLDALLETPDEHPEFVANHREAWLAHLTAAESCLLATRNPTWCPDFSKFGFCRVYGRCIEAWIAAGDPDRASRLGELAQVIYPEDPGLLFRLAKTAAARGDWVHCVPLVRQALDAGAVPASSEDVIDLMTAAIRDGGPEVHAVAAAIQGEVFRRAGDWTRAYATLLLAEELAPGNLPDFAVEALFLATLRQHEYAEVERFGAIYARRHFGPARMCVVASGLRMALDQKPDRPQLWLVSSRLCLLLGRPNEALQGIARALGFDATAVTQVLADHCDFSPADPEAVRFRIALAKVILSTGDVAHAFQALQCFDSPSASPEGIAASADLCREWLVREPQCLPAREFLVRLLVREGCLEDALAHGRSMHQQTRDAEVAASIAWRLGAAAEIARQPAQAAAAREFEFEVWLDSGDVGSALDALHATCAHPSTPDADLERLLPRLQAVPGTHEQAPRAKLLAALILQRQGRCPEAARVFLDLVRRGPPLPVFHAARVALADLNEHLPDRLEGLVALALGWLRLDQPNQARGPLLACIAAQRPEVPDLLAELRQRSQDGPPPPEWLDLDIAASIALGGEERLLEAARGLHALADAPNPDFASISATARQLLEASPSDALRRHATLLLVRSALARLDEFELCEIAARLRNDPPTWCDQVADLLENSNNEVGQILATDLRSLPLVPEDDALLPDLLAADDPEVRVVNAGAAPALVADFDPDSELEPASPKEPVGSIGEVRSDDPSPCPLPTSAPSARVPSALSEASPMPASEMPSASEMGACLETPPSPAIPVFMPIPASAATLDEVLRPAVPVETPLPVPPPSPRRFPRSRALREALAQETVVVDPRATEPPPKPAQVPSEPVSANGPQPSVRSPAAGTPRRKALSESLRRQSVDWDPRRIQSHPPMASSSARPSPSAPRHPGPSPRSRSELAIPETEDCRELLELAHQATRRHDLRAARALLGRLLELHPDDPVASYHLNALEEVDAKGEARYAASR